MTTDDERALLDLVGELLHITSVNAYARHVSVNALAGALIHHLSFMPRSTCEYVASVFTDFTPIQDLPLEHRLHSNRAKWH
jgi:hypothetical protein